MKILSLIFLLTLIAYGNNKNNKVKVSQASWEQIYRQGPAFKINTSFKDVVSDCTGKVGSPVFKNGAWIYPVVKMACPYREAPYIQVDESYLSKMVVSNK